MSTAPPGSPAAALAAALADGRPLVMGIVNVTPDSFSDGGRFADPGRAVAQATALAVEGAALVDIGGESTRPGHSPVSLEEERARVMPVILALAGACPVPISIDTTKAALAREALAHGASLVNDQWGLQGDPAMADVVAEAGAMAVLMHNRAAIEDGLDIEAELLRFFERSLAGAARAGIPEHRLILDPGVGFGKTPPQQIAALRAIPAIRGAFGRPVLVGASRKSLLGRLTGTPVERRLPETLAAHLVAFGWGARLFRAHDVAPHVAALTVAAALAGQTDAAG